MTNLIPPRAKKQLLKEYWVRVVSVWLMLWAAALLLGAIAILPVFILVSHQVVIHKESAELASEKVVNYENVATELVRVSQLAQIIIDEGEVPAFSYYLDLFNRLEGSGVEINQLNLTREGLAIGLIQVSGIAKDRQSLASFRDRLLSQEEIVEVDLPISNLTLDKDITFNITVTLNDTNKI